MNPIEKLRFGALLTDALSFYRRDVSDFALSVWWQACQPFSFEQVTKALTAHAMDPDHGRFAPMPADIVRQLAGTKTDRSLIAWGKVLDAAQRVGAYWSVCFDDGLIHAAIEDVGGWLALCRSTTDELPFMQKRFCESYRAYTTREGVKYPPMLGGQHDMENVLRGHRAAPPVLIGDRAKAEAVYFGGCEMPKTAITQVAALVDRRLAMGNAA